MSRLQYTTFYTVLVLSAIIVTGCSSKGNEFYKHQPSLPPLEVPPDLTLLSVESGFEVPQVAAVERKKVVLADGSNISLKKDGKLRWLHIEASPDDVWVEVKDYWITNKIPLNWQNIKLGLMETDWIDSYDSEFSRDRFRIRLETSDGGKSTEVYLVHRGNQDEVIEGEIVHGWVSSFNDPELEIEVLGDMLSYLGLNAERKEALLSGAKKRTDDARLELDGEVPQIVLREPLSRSWKFTLQAIDRMGDVVTLKDKAQGWIDVRISEDGNTADFVPGFSLSDDDRSVYRLQLKQEGKDTQIVVLSDAGQPDRAGSARSYLEKLHGYY